MVTVDESMVTVDKSMVTLDESMGTVDETYDFKFKILSTQGKPWAFQQLSIREERHLQEQ